MLQSWLLQCYRLCKNNIGEVVCWVDLHLSVVVLDLGHDRYSALSLLGLALQHQRKMDFYNSQVKS